MMKLHQNAHAPIREPGEEPDLPQWVPTIDLLTQDRHNCPSSLPRPSRCIDACIVDVSTQIELGVVDPNRAVQTQWDFLEFPHQLGNERQPLLNSREHRLETESIDAGGIDNRETAHVLMPRQRLTGKKQRICARESSCHELALGIIGRLSINHQSFERAEGHDLGAPILLNRLAIAFGGLASGSLVSHATSGRH